MPPLLAAAEIRLAQTIPASAGGNRPAADRTRRVRPGEPAAVLVPVSDPAPPSRPPRSRARSPKVGGTAAAVCLGLAWQVSLESYCQPAAPARAVRPLLALRAR